MKKPSIPSVMGVTDTATRTILTAMKENIELTNGLRTTPVQILPIDASLQGVISKVNEIIERLNSS